MINQISTEVHFLPESLKYASYFIYILVIGLEEHTKNTTIYYLEPLKQEYIESLDRKKDKRWC